MSQPTPPRTQGVLPWGPPENTSQHGLLPVPRRDSGASILSPSPGLGQASPLASQPPILSRPAGHNGGPSSHPAAPSLLRTLHDSPWLRSPPSGQTRMCERLCPVSLICPPPRPDVLSGDSSSNVHPLSWDHPVLPLTLPPGRPPLPALARDVCLREDTVPVSGGTEGEKGLSTPFVSLSPSP